MGETVTPYINQPSLPPPWQPALSSTQVEMLRGQIARVRNNGARRRLTKALDKAMARKALQEEVERMRAVNAKTLTLDLPAGMGPHVQVFRSAHPPRPGDELVPVAHAVGVR